MKEKTKHVNVVKLRRNEKFCIQAWFKHVLTDACNDLTILQNERGTSVSF